MQYVCNKIVGVLTSAVDLEYRKKTRNGGSAGAEKQELMWKGLEFLTSST